MGDEVEEIKGRGEGRGERRGEFFFGFVVVFVVDVHDFGGGSVVNVGILSLFAASRLSKGKTRKQEKKTKLGKNN